ncbi:MAG: hypothetical protein ACXVC6_11340 [Bacteroidia bacterium]
MRYIFYTLVFVLCMGPLFAQDESQYIEKDFVETRDIHYKESLLFINGIVTVPNVIANPGFRHTFKGIYEANMSLNLRIGSGLSIGVGMKNSLISTQERIQNLDMRMQLYTAFVRFTYTKYHNERTHSTLGLNMGYNNSFYTHVVPLYSPIISKEYSSLVMEPEYSINFVVGETFTIGLFASYAFYATPFEAAKIGMQDYSSASTQGNTKANGTLNVGFCFHIGMGKEFKPNNKD